MKKNKEKTPSSKDEPKGLSVSELVTLADSFGRMQNYPKVISLYVKWIEDNAAHALLHVILFNYGTVLTKVGDAEGACKAFERSIELNPDFAPAYINLGRLHEAAGAKAQAVESMKKALDRLSDVTGINISHKTMGLNQLGRIFADCNEDTTAESMLRQSLELDPSQHEVIQHYIAARQRLCEWPVIKRAERVSDKILIEGMSPLSMAIHADDPMMQLALNASYNVRDIGNPQGVLKEHWAAREAGKKGSVLRIGYLSSDLREHAIGFLMAEMFELHDRSKVEIYVYYCGAVRNDPMMERIKKTADRWVVVTGLSDREAAARIFDDGIQILVDVNGYTREGRTSLVALRPAPVIVNWLGYPGSMGSPYHHYIVADDWIVPPEHEIFFSEKVLRLPCYQPNDRKRKIDSAPVSRAQMGLPENETVFCCFNGTQKISSRVFALWMSILKRVPRSVLWLMGGTDEANLNLRAAAASHGVGADRLVFAAKLPNPKHLARYPLADLFLDTFPYGAHTTASDALWMGVPMLTLSGLSFASRVCGSLIRSAGLPEMVCASAEEYVGRAVALGKDREALASYREKLAASRDTCDLFNLPKLVSSLEGLFERMWADGVSGALPKPDLRNMELYLDLGSEPHEEPGELLTFEAYRREWRKRLSQRDAVRPVPPDPRFCATPFGQDD
ncbi:MAG: tetratricopeptide repeat protein [Alphaproteobacteria bacterium]|nr:tetratricopeptide repeat protein [Alphaproteobacteria bacterium]